MKTVVSCILITYNSAKFLPSFFESLRALPGGEVELELIVIDNASSDASGELSKKIWGGEMKLIENNKNLGYSGAAEQGVRLARGKYVLIANPDIVFEPDYIRLLVNKMESDTKIGAISGKLLKYDFSENKKTKIVDSAGLVMHKNRRCVDRGQGGDDCGQFDKAEEVFGVTGAAPLYRKSALVDCEIGGAVFDPDFFMYKEDVDISWRLRLLGYSCFYLPQAVAYHGRGTSVLERESLADVAKNRKFLPRFTRQHSYRNERVMRLRNEFVSHVLLDFPFILWRESLMFAWIVIHEPSLFKSMYQLFSRMPREWKKRLEFQKKIKITPQEMRRWFT